MQKWGHRAGTESTFAFCVYKVLCSWSAFAKAVCFFIPPLPIFPLRNHSSPFFQSGSLAASQILANWEQQDPHLKDHTPCPL